MKDQKLWNISTDGELDFRLRDDVPVRYRPTSFFESPHLSKWLMAACLITDGGFAFSMLSSRSYDYPIFLVFQIAGLLLGMDVLPIILGSQYKRMKQGFKVNKPLFTLVLTLFAGVFVINAELRITGVQTEVLENAANSYLAGAQAASSGKVSPDTIGMMIFGIFVPLLTSGISFYASYCNSSPLATMMERLEELIDERRDELRRLDAVITEYDLDVDFGDRILEDDDRRYREMLNQHRALALSYCEYVREKLEEHLGDPSSISLLAGESFTDLLARLDREINALRGPIEAKDIAAPNAERPAIPIDEVA